MEKIVQTVIVLAASAAALALFILGVRQLKIRKNPGSFMIALLIAFNLIGFNCSGQSSVPSAKSGIEQSDKKTEETQEWKDFKAFWNKLDQVAPKKEASKLDEEIVRLNRQLGGIKEMTRIPTALFIVDPSKDKIALMEAHRVGVTVIAICDTNCNPDDLDVIIPANDDAIRAVKLICSKMADAVIEGKGIQVIVPKEDEIAAIEAATTAPPANVMEAVLAEAKNITGKTDE